MKRFFSTYYYNHKKYLEVSALHLLIPVKKLKVVVTPSSYPTEFIHEEKPKRERQVLALQGQPVDPWR